MNTKNANGGLLQRTLSKAFPTERTAIVAELLLLTLLGAFAIILRTKLRVPVNMPGHHGVEVMALLIIGRYVSGISVASSISGLAAALIMFFPFMGIKDPYLPVIYLIMGISIDLLYFAFKDYRKYLALFALVGGIAYMMIPLSRLVIFGFTGFPYESFYKFGFFLPFITHFVFGVAGAVLGAGLIYSLNRLKK
ncbi:MAG: hypothetical protein JXR58_05715 [Bacteroidales bacterium]|nr:hypothetical protein [Bacteroidales bacterium]